MRELPDVSTSAACMRSRNAVASCSRRPMNRNRIPFLCRSSTSLSSASRKRPISIETSSRGRCQFSLEKANRVSTSTPRLAQPSTVCLTDLTPIRCPAGRGKARRAAQRPLPSMITATWRGKALDDFFGLAAEGAMRLNEIANRCRSIRPASVPFPCPSAPDQSRRRTCQSVSVCRPVPGGPHPAKQAFPSACP